MSDLLVIGAGYWGQATALLAESRGYKVHVVDNGSVAGASRAASGHFAYSWYKGLWKDEVRRSVHLASMHGWQMTQTGAERNGKIIEDWYTFNPWEILDKRPADERSTIYKLLPCSQKNIVVAAGAYTDQILESAGLAKLGVTGLGGKGVVFRSLVRLERVKLLPINPYRAYNMRNWGNGTVRLGDTLEVTFGNHKGEEYLRKMLAAAKEPRGNIIRTYWGLRPMLKDGPTVKMVAPNIVAATGGGRTGGMLAFWAADRALELLGLT